MPRSARLDAPGVLHHIMIRGIDGTMIFCDNNDSNDMSDRLAELLPATNTSCYAWAFLPNHAHFLFRSGDKGLPTLMRRLLTGYAVRFNRRHERKGHLFQNRYKSIVCQEDPYLLELVRYIHLNPLRAGLVTDVEDLARYQYCGHTVLMGQMECEWQDKEYILSYFGETLQEGRTNYYTYLKEGIGKGRRPELTGGTTVKSPREDDDLSRNGSINGDERILGDPDFVSDVLSRANQRMDRRSELVKLGYTLEKLEQRILDLYQLDKGDLYSRSRQKIRSEARSVFCYWAVQELGFSGTEMARLLNMSQPGVAHAIRRGEGIVKMKKLKMLGP